MKPLCDEDLLPLVNILRLTPASSRKHYGLKNLHYCESVAWCFHCRFYDIADTSCCIDVNYNRQGIANALKALFIKHPELLV